MVGAIYTAVLAGALSGAADARGHARRGAADPRRRAGDGRRAAPGQTGCLGRRRPTPAASRSARARVTLRSVPGEHAVLVGQLVIASGADVVTVRGLELDGTNPLGRPSPLVNGHDATFTGNDVHRAVETCFVLGDRSWGVPEGTLIVGNRIHDCGVDGTNKDHGVYVRHASGTLIEGNVIRDNPDRGVQLYPNADRTVVRGNVIDGNGEGVIFSGDGRRRLRRQPRRAATSSRRRGCATTSSHWWTANGRHRQRLRAQLHLGRRAAAPSSTPTVGFKATREHRQTPLLRARPRRSTSRHD